MSCRVLAIRASERIASTQQATVLMDRLIAQLKKYRVWAGGFEETLQRARSASGELGPDFVWQDEMVDFWAPFSEIQREIFTLDEALRRSSEALADLIESYIDPPSRAQIEFATEGARFLPRNGHQRRQIAYQVRRLEMWHQNFAQWLRMALGELEVARQEIEEPG